MRKKMSKWQFERLMRRYDGEDGGGTSTATTTSTATDTTTATTDTSTTDTTAQQAQPFKAFASEAEYQKEVDFKIQQALKTHEEKLKGKLTPEIRKQVEKEANMTAEQKYQAQLDDLEAQRKALAADKNRIKAETILKDVPEDERATMLDAIVSDDVEETEKRANALSAAIEKAVNEKIKTAMKSVTVPNSASANNKPSESWGKKLGEELANAKSVSQKTVDYYKLGGKR